MATKNLARTVIEVGRSKSSKDDRKRLRKMERLEAANYCRDAKGLANLGTIDYEDANDDDYSRPIDALQELDSAPVDRAGYIVQLDKLGPAMRWMESRCGRPWDEVFSELSQKFRNKGIALSHVVDTHMMQWVQDGTKPNHYRWTYYEFIVDENGILRKNTEARPWRRRKRKATHYDWADYKKARGLIETWAGSRKVITRGEHYYWAEPVNVCRATYRRPDGSLCIRCMVCNENNKTLEEYKPRYGSRWWAIRWYWMRARKHCPYTRYRQDVPFSQEDHDTFDSLPHAIQKELVVKELDS